MEMKNEADGSLKIETSLTNFQCNYDASGPLHSVQSLTTLISSSLVKKSSSKEKNKRKFEIKID